MLAAAVNAPAFLGRRLWQETRIALFERSVDERSVTHQQRGHTPRVAFGNDWVRHGVVEIFREDIARFRVLLSAERDEPPAAVLAAGGVPKLSALRLHSGTIYRWNRACYGLSDNGKPHLRIEHRALPAGPTVRDEVANAAFFYGLVAHLRRAHGDVARVMRFDAAKTQLLRAPRATASTRSSPWIDGPPRPAAAAHRRRAAARGARARSSTPASTPTKRAATSTSSRRASRSAQTGAAWADAVDRGAWATATQPRAIARSPRRCSSGSGAASPCTPGRWRRARRRRATTASAS